MNLSFLSSDEEQVLLVLVEVEAHTSGETVDEWFLLAVRELLILVNHELQLDNFLWLQLVLHQVPEGDAAI